MDITGGDTQGWKEVCEVKVYSASSSTDHRPDQGLLKLPAAFRMIKSAGAVKHMQAKL